MNWLRSKAKRLSLLALFALALQLGLSSGHIHHNPAFAAAAPAQVHVDKPDTGRSPDSDDYCALCATVTLASATLADAAPPVLPVPQAFAAFRPLTVAQSVAPWSRGHLFQSRAPPLS